MPAKPDRFLLRLYLYSKAGSRVMLSMQNPFQVDGSKITDAWGLEYFIPQGGWVEIEGRLI